MYVSEKDIDKFLAYIRGSFPHMSITPKLHIMEDHVCPFLRKGHMGLGFYGEQGIEGIHSDFNKQIPRFRQVLEHDVRLRQLILNHHVKTSPKLVQRVPVSKKRSLKRKATE